MPAKFVLFKEGPVIMQEINGGEIAKVGDKNIKIKINSVGSRFAIAELVFMKLLRTISMTILSFIRYNNVMEKSLLLLG